jgi:HK97 family phage major capsid protein
MTMEELTAKISAVVDKSIAPIKAEIEKMKAEGKDTSKLEELVKKAVSDGEKKKNAAGQEWDALLEGARLSGKEPEINAKTAANMIGKIAAAGAWALKETGAMHMNDKQMLFDFTKKMWPREKVMHDIMQKDMEADIPSAGGYGIPQILLPDYVNYLYAKTLLDKIGVMKYPMVNGNMRLARVDATSSFTWGGETPTGNKTQPTLGDITLNSKKGTAVVPISNTLLRQNAIGIDGLISRDLQRIATIALDTALLYGTGGSYQPLGLANISGIQTSGSTGSATPLTVQFPIDMIALLEESNVPMENVAWLMNPVAKGWMMGKAFSSGPFAWAAEMAQGKTLNGYPFYSSATVANSGASPTWANIWVADFSELVWGVSYDIAIDISREGTYVNSAGTTVSAFQRDETLIRLITECDFNVRHPASFVEAFVSKGS